MKPTDHIFDSESEEDAATSEIRKLAKANYQEVFGAEGWTSRMEIVREVRQKARSEEECVAPIMSILGLQGNWQQRFQDFWHGGLYWKPWDIVVDMPHHIDEGCSLRAYLQPSLKLRRVLCPNTSQEQTVLHELPMLLLNGSPSADEAKRLKGIIDTLRSVMDLCFMPEPQQSYQAICFLIYWLLGLVEAITHSTGSGTVFSLRSIRRFLEDGTGDNGWRADLQAD